MVRAAVIGLGRFGSTLARELVQYGAEVIAIDTEASLVDEVRGAVAVAVRADGTDERTLRQLGVAGVDVAVVSMGDNFEGTQLCVVTLKRRLEVRRIVAKASNPIRERILRRIGCDEVVSPERESAIRLAHHLVLPRILEHVHLGTGSSLVQVVAPPSLVGKDLREIDARNRFGVNIVAIKRRVGADGRPVPTGAETAVLAVSSLTGGAGRTTVEGRIRGSHDAGSEAAPEGVPTDGSARAGSGVAGTGVAARGVAATGGTEQVKVSPGAEDRILEGDVLVVIGDDRGIARLAE